MLNKGLCFIIVLAIISICTVSVNAELILLNEEGVSFFNEDILNENSIKLTDAPFITPPPDITITENENYKEIHKYTHWWHATCQHVAHDEWVAWRIYKDGRPDEELGSMHTYYQLPPSTYDPNLHEWSEWEKLSETTERRHCTNSVGWWATQGQCPAFEERAITPDPDTLTGTITPTPSDSTLTPTITSITALPSNNSNTFEAIIESDSQFKAAYGIPSSENVHVNVLKANNYLYNYTTRKIEGNITYPVTVSKTYTLNWKVDNGEPVSITDEDGNKSTVWHSDWDDNTETVTVVKTYNISRGYSYYLVDNLDLYTIDRAQITNSALPGGTLIITPNPAYYAPPTVDIWHSTNNAEHVTGATSKNIDLGTETINNGKDGKPKKPDPDWTSDAQSAVGDITVKNDSLIVNGNVVLNGEKTSTNSPTSAAFPQSPNISPETLLTQGLTVDGNYPNGVYQSSGTLYYKRLPNALNNSQLEVSKTLSVNPVTIYTPVVCYGVISDDNRAFNQEITPSSRTSLILDRPVKLSFPASGSHSNFTSWYSLTDFSKYTKDKQIKFPFEVYKVDNAGYTLFKANEWHSIPVAENDISIYVPTWVNEGDYTVEFREIALNAASYGNVQDNANLERINYVAQSRVDVRVIGRLYGFKITDINDYPNWESVFRTAAGSAEHNGNYYTVGTKDQNGNPNGNSSQITLPILNGNHPYDANLGALKTGYKFKYELTSIGNYYGQKDYIAINPKFYYVPYSGGDKQEVDLYYNESFNGEQNYFVKAGSSLDKQNLKYIKLGDSFRNVPNTEIEETTAIVDNANYIASDGNAIRVDTDTFRNKSVVTMEGFGSITLPWRLRTFVGNPNGLDSNETPERIKKSVQIWHGEYYIPDFVYAAPKGMEILTQADARDGLDGQESFWLKDGYIVVKFEIKSVKDTAGESLSYWGKDLISQMWDVEGYNFGKVDSSGISYSLGYGDVVFYHANKRSSEDYSSGGNQ